MSEQHVEREQRVTPLELFFDLVFVFTLAELTTVLFHAPNGRGVLQVVLMLLVLVCILPIQWLTRRGEES